jgi:hypothetical protein
MSYFSFSPSSYFASILGLVFLILALSACTPVANFETIQKSVVSTTKKSRSLDPETLLGASRNDLASLFGPADFLRADQGVEVLQYRMPNCIVDFVLSSTDKVTSFHGRHRVNGQSYDDVDCMSDLAARRNDLE